MSKTDKAKQLYEEAIKPNFPHSFFPASYSEKDDWVFTFMPPGKHGWELMMQSAELGYAPAQFQIGAYYIFDSDHRKQDAGTLEDYESLKKLADLEHKEEAMGIEWMKKAACQNHPESCLVLGNAYLHGIFTLQKDESSAFKYYQLGARSGNAVCIFKLALCYFHGIGIAENNNAAFRWFQDAEKAGCKTAWPYLGECYLKGYGTEIDITMAINAYENTMSFANPGAFDFARLNLSLIYLGGKGYEFADFDRAKELLESIPNDSDEYETAQGLLMDFQEMRRNYANWEYNNQQGSSNTSGSKGGCYVATAVYGSYDCPEVWTLRRFRDTILDATWYGRLFIRIYYAVSPWLVKHFGKQQWFVNIFKPHLDNMVHQCNECGLENTPYNDKY